MTKYTNRRQNLIETLQVVLFFSIVYLLFFAPVIFNGGILAPGDGIAQSVPSFYAPRTLWTDTLYSGFPAAADPQVQYWYPISLLLGIIPHSWNCFMLSAYVLASCFTYGYVKKLTSSKFAAIFSGLAYGMSGFMMVHLGHTAMVHSAAWIPLIIWSGEELRHKLTWRWFLIGCVAIACSILAGHPQISVYSFVLAAVYALVLGWKAAVGKWRYYRSFLAIAILGVALGAIQVIPTAELASLGLRPEMTFEEFNSFALPPVEAIKLIFPFVLGASHPRPWLYSIPYFGSWNFVEMSGYAGITILILALIGLIYSPLRSLAKFWGFTALFCFLLTLGDVTPLAWIIYHIPFLNNFRVPARHLIEITFAFSVLAGMGLTAMTQHLLSQKQLTKVLAYSSGFVGLLLLVVILSQDTIIDEITDEVSATAAQQFSLLPWSNLALGVPLLILLAAIVGLIYFNKFPHQQLVRYLLLLLLALDLASFGWFCEWQDSPPLSIMQPTAMVQKYGQILNRSHQRMLSIRGIEAHWDEIPTNISRLWDVPSAGGYGPLILSRMSELMSMDVLGKVDTPDWMLPANRSLDLMAVRYVTIPEDLATIDDLDRDSEFYSALDQQLDVPNYERWNLADRIGQAQVYENLRVQPRAWLVPEVLQLKPAEILRAVQTSNLPDGRTYEPTEMALVETDLVSTELSKASFDPQATVEFNQLSQTHLQIETSSSSPSFLVLSDVYYPGWRARIDGKQAPILATNYVLRGIALPQGSHTVDFVFRSSTFHLAVGISMAAVFACLYGCVWLGKREGHNSNRNKLRT
ncbi:MAG: YfhO family protein [Cyanobacteria bacterium J06623_7]